MAGGLFGRPFVLNIKCIVFSLLCMALFLYRPSYKRRWLLYSALFAIFVVSYVALAWYDYAYDCRLQPLQRGTLSLTGLFKPPMHMPAKQKVGSKKHPVETNRRALLVNMSHVLFIAPLLFYLVWKRKKANPMVYPLIFALSVFTLLYHGLSLLYRVH